MWLMLQLDEPEDFVIATGESNTLEQFVDETFSQLRLNWRDHVETKNHLIRPSEITISKANPRKARDKINWQAKSKMSDVVRLLIEYHENI